MIGSAIHWAKKLRKSCLKHRQPDIIRPGIALLRHSRLKIPLISIN